MEPSVIWAADCADRPHGRSALARAQLAPALTGSSLLRETGLSEQPLTAIGAAARAGCAGGESRVPTSNSGWTCFRPLGRYLGTARAWDRFGFLPSGPRACPRARDVDTSIGGSRFQAGSIRPLDLEAATMTRYYARACLVPGSAVVGALWSDRVLAVPAVLGLRVTSGIRSGPRSRARSVGRGCAGRR